MIPTLTPQVVASVRLLHAHSLSVRELCDSYEEMRAELDRAQRLMGAAVSGKATAERRVAVLRQQRDALNATIEIYKKQNAELQIQLADLKNMMK